MTVGLASLAAAFNPLVSERRSDACLLTLKETDDSPIGDYMRFQYFPETVQDSYKVNYQSKEIPGASLPILQWINGSGRTISFTAVLTCDVDLMAEAGQTLAMPSASRLEALRVAGQDSRNIDIRAAIVWLRRHQLPIYSPSGDARLAAFTTFAPRKVRLFLHNSGIGLYGGVASSTTPDSLVAVMTQCDVTLETFFRSGLPRIAVVQLSFEQIAQYQGQVEFPSVTPDLDSLVADGSDINIPSTETAGVVPYRLKSIANVSFGV